MYRRTRTKRGPIVIGALVVALGCFVVFKFWANSDTPDEAGAASGKSAEQALLQGTGTPALSGGSQKPPSEPRVPPAEPKSDVKATGPVAPTTTGNPGKITMGSPPQKPATEGRPAEPKPTLVAGSSSSADPAPSGKTDASSAAKAQKPEDAPPPTIDSGSETPSTGKSSALLQAGLDLVARNQPVQARRALSQALSMGLGAVEADRARTAVTQINDRLVFGAEIAKDDPYVQGYTVKSGDLLANLPKRMGLEVDYRFLQRINRISSPERLNVGQKLKLVKGPFHAVVIKKDFRLDLYMGDPGSSDRVYVRSYPVGLGEFGSTPEGAYIVKQNSKLMDPAWSNPRTGEHFAANDPNNPIGDRWIGLIGTSDNIRDLTGYGIHGTIDPSSIGQQKSMGCVRMHAEDVAQVYELLVEGVSTVEIHGEDYP